MLYIGIWSLFVQTSHTTPGPNHHVFTYNTTAKVLALGFNIIPIATAWYLWRKKDKIAAWIFLGFIPIFSVFIFPQVLIERIELTPQLLICRREPPHSKYNADIDLDQVRAVSITHRDGKPDWYIFFSRDNQSTRLPANTIINAAWSTLAADLKRRKIPITESAGSNAGSNEEW